MTTPPHPLPDDSLAIHLPTAVWSELVGLLLGLSWYEPRREATGELAGRLYAAYIRALGADPAAVVELSLLPERLRQLVIDHG